MASVKRRMDRFKKQLKRAEKWSRKYHPEFWEKIMNLYHLNLSLFNEGEEPSEFPVYLYQAESDEQAITAAKNDISAICYEHKMQCVAYSIVRVIPGNSPRKTTDESVLFANIICR